MATVTEEDHKALRKLIEANLSQQGETGSVLLVETLTNVSLGYLAHSFGNLPPISRETEREQLAPHVVATYLHGTRPSPTNNYMAQLRQVGLAYLREVNPPSPVSGDIVTILVTLAMGHTKETDPRPTRMVATTRFVDLYLAGR